MVMTYSATYITDILEFLKKRGFSVDRESESGGCHMTVSGARLQMIDPLGIKYEIFVNPLKEKTNGK